MKGLYFIFSFTFLVSSLGAQVTYNDAFPNLKFSFPVEMQSPPDGTDRIFVVEQEGRIKVFPRRADVNNSEVVDFLDVTGADIAAAGGTERGLLGLAFHPDFATNGHLFVFYTGNSTAAEANYKSVVARYTVSGTDPNFVDPSTQVVVFEFDKNQLEGNHNGGKIAFGPDGYLYVSIGDGGGANDPRRNAQNINNVFGSILRVDIDVDGSNPLESNPALPNGNYEIPSDNPFVGKEGLDEIYAYGIRNTWKFSIDFATNTIWGADVGQDTYEEINIIENGKNYGWSRFESDFVRNPSVVINEPTELPVFAYERVGNRSITGGHVYRGTQIASRTPDISGKYIYGDYVSGRVWALDYDPITGGASSSFLFQTDGLPISSFAQDIEGELYFTSYGRDVGIYKLEDGDSASSGVPVDGIGVWSAMDQGIEGTVQAIEASPDGTVYYGGDFSQAGGVNATNIVAWNAEIGWHNIGNANGSVQCLALATNGDLYAGGTFTNIGGTVASGIAVWNGSNWAALGVGIGGTVNVLEIGPNNTVYAGGAFEAVDNITVNNIVAWDGTRWSALTDSATGEPGTNNEIRSLAIDSDNLLYVGGNFDQAGGKTANTIATWDGSSWGTLGVGTIGFVEAIAVTDTDVYLGGNFVLAGDMTVNRVARWNKEASVWSALGIGVSNIVTGLIHDGENLYASGSFNAANLEASNAIAVSNIAQWSEVNGWRALGTGTSVGVDAQINALAFARDTAGVRRIYVGGNFTRAGVLSASNTAIWEVGPRSTCFSPIDFAEDLSFTTEESTWSSGVFDISCFVEATVSMDIEAEEPENFENVDYLDVFYKVDGGNEVAISENRNGFTRKFISAVTSGDSLEVIIRYNTTQQIEVYNVFDLVINGEPCTGPSLTIADVTIDCDNAVVTLSPVSDGGDLMFTWTGPNGFVSSEQSPEVSEAGIYSLTVTGENGCTSSASVEVTSNSTVPTATLDTPIVDCDGAVVNLQVVSQEDLSYTWTFNSSVISTDSIVAVTVAGDYEVLITSANGCTATLSYQLEENVGLLDAIITTTAATQVDDGTASIDVLNTVSAVTILWDNGQTGTTATGLAAGEYTVTVTDTLGCDFIFAFTIETTTAAEDLSAALKLRIYPTITSDIVNLEAVVDGDFKILVVDLRGVVVHQETVGQRGGVHLDIDLSTYSPGVYWVSVINAQGRLTRMVIKH